MRFKHLIKEFINLFFEGGASNLDLQNKYKILKELTVMLTKDDESHYLKLNNFRKNIFETRIINNPGISKNLLYISNNFIETVYKNKTKTLLNNL